MLNTQCCTDLSSIVLQLKDMRTAYCSKMCTEFTQAQMEGLESDRLRHRTVLTSHFCYRAQSHLAHPELTHIYEQKPVTVYIKASESI